MDYPVPPFASGYLHSVSIPLRSGRRKNSATPRVKAGDKLVIIEAMKMRTTISAQADGTTKDILVKKGVQVDSDDLLVVMA